MSEVYVHSFAPMGTVVTIQVVGHGETEALRRERADLVARAASWFERVEQVCSRFDSSTELRRLTDRAGEAVTVSPMLFEAIRFALAVAEESGGAFDPTIGHRMEAHGFNRHYQTGELSTSGIAPAVGASWRDVLLDPESLTVRLLNPLVLDLGAVAKGLAVDLAARELETFGNFAVDAGGDLFLAGHNADGAPWSVGIRHPRAQSVIETLSVSGSAVCTSGDYEKRSLSHPGVHHIMDARTGHSAAEIASVTVIASSAMVADALATAAFALGPADGLHFLEQHGVRGVMFTPSLERLETAGPA